MKMTLEQFEALVALMHEIADFKIRHQSDIFTSRYNRDDAERACRDLLCEE